MRVVISFVRSAVERLCLKCLILQSAWLTLLTVALRESHNYHDLHGAKISAEKRFDASFTRGFARFGADRSARIRLSSCRARGRHRVVLFYGRNSSRRAGSAYRDCRDSLSSFSPPDLPQHFKSLLSRSRMSCRAARHMPAARTRTHATYDPAK